MEEKYAIISNFSMCFANIIYEIAIISFLKKFKKRRIFQMNLSHVESNQSTSLIATQSGSTEERHTISKFHNKNYGLLFISWYQTMRGKNVITNGGNCQQKHVGDSII